MEANCANPQDFLVLLVCGVFTVALLDIFGERLAADEERLPSRLLPFAD